MPNRSGRNKMRNNQFAGMVARVEGLRGRMAEAERQAEGLFEALLNESFGGG
jgi:hypothetical protein